MTPRFALLLLATIGGMALTAPSNSTAADLSRIKYDHQCFTIDGHDTFLYSGSFHYFRCPKPLWADRFQKMKDAGLNCVETYVAWNWHEQQPPASLDDFSQVDMTDLTDWLDMAINRFGFYVILRPGPYICAEWDGGGYPQWLVTKRPAGAAQHWLRSDNPVYLDWCKHWYTAAAKATVPFQITHMPPGKPGVILWQIENEYNYASDVSETAKLHQLQALAHDSRDLGIDIPLITCMTDSNLFREDPYLLQNVVECRNTYPGFDPSNELRDLNYLLTYQPEKPRIVTELQGGWFSEVGNKLSQDMGYTPQQINHVTLLAWALGYTGANYYMMFGGTNIGDWGASNKTTTYDYAAPIRESGGVGPRYFAVQAMGNFLTQHAQQLLRADDLDVSATDPLNAVSAYLRRAADGSRFLFLVSNQQDLGVPEVHVTSKDGRIDGNIECNLAPFDAKILYLTASENNLANGMWYPQPVAPPQRPTTLPSPINITTARVRLDPGPAADSWHDLPPGASIEDAGIFDRRYLYYRAKLPATTQPYNALSAYLANQDSILPQLNGKPLDVHRVGRGTLIAPLPKLRGTDNQLLLLYENGGRDNGGAGIDFRCGLKNAVIVSSITRAEGIGNGVEPDLANPSELSPIHWQISGEPAGYANKWWDNTIDDSNWQPVNVPNSPPTASNPTSLYWYRLRFALHSPDPHVWVPWKLHLQATGNGFIYLNGHALGRYWEVGPQSDFFLPECWLNFGPGSTNVVTLCLSPTKQTPCIQNASVSPYSEFAESR